ncbi:hypothetical protein SAMN05421504_104231 [Amycolatopsis xylanica]|uniref:Uncharacterized protein n=1 Tax=Amycolatopsis xylanica TaxID=589385 RepID=A0A1H3GGJ8_9PSEU|nr:hypothetical protein [Amycolatopsis xylanica]SDY01768.1 hypothetical protein SAMN05421504_104231 [Amycolatopsis xylanica]
MALDIALLQELPSTEETLLGVQDCCWNSLIGGCQMWSLTLSTCHSNTNG